jgi:hypoxanthine phosphoribosyltransferase
MIPSHCPPPSIKAITDFVLLKNREIKNRIRKMAREIYDYYFEAGIFQVQTMTVLTGASRFSNALLDQIQLLNNKYPKRPPIAFHEDSTMISSYGQGFSSTKDPKEVAPLQFSTHNRELLLIEDIIEQGFVINYIKYMLNYNTKKPNDLKIVTLLDKPQKRNIDNGDIKPDWSGFEIPNYFVVGFGLDWRHIYRNVGDIVVVKEEYKDKFDYDRWISQNEHYLKWLALNNVAA